MNGIEPIVWKCLHKIENYPEYNKYREAHYKSPGWFRQVEQTIEKQDQEQLIRLKTDQYCRQEQVGYRNNGNGDECPKVYFHYIFIRCDISFPLSGSVPFNSKYSTFGDQNDPPGLILTKILVSIACLPTIVAYTWCLLSVGERIR
jgi:hypothetical protein